MWRLTAVLPIQWAHCVSALNIAAACERVLRENLAMKGNVIPNSSPAKGGASSVAHTPHRSASRLKGNKRSTTASLQVLPSSHADTGPAHPSSTQHPAQLDSNRTQTSQMAPLFPVGPSVGPQPTKASEQSAGKRRHSPAIGPEPNPAKRARLNNLASLTGELEATETTQGVTMASGLEQFDGDGNVGVPNSPCPSRTMVLSGSTPAPAPDSNEATQPPSANNIDVDGAEQVTQAFPVP